MSLTFAVLLIAQVGPNPALGAPPSVPEELLEQRRRNAERQQEADETQRSRLAECLSLVAESERRGTEFARNWRETAGADDAAQATHCLGFSHIRAGRFGEAQASFATALGEAREDNPAYRARLGGMAGNAALVSGDGASAERYFAGAVEDAQRAADAGLTAGLSVDHARALVALRRPDEAATALNTARTLDPSNTRAWLLSATLARRLDQLVEAQEHIAYAAELSPDDPAIALEAGVIAALSGSMQDARRNFETVLSLAPDGNEAPRARSYLEQLAPPVASSGEEGAQ